MTQVRTGAICRTCVRDANADVLARRLGEDLGGEDRELAMVFVSPDVDRQRLGDALKQSFGRVPLVGCTTAGEIGPAGYSQGGATGWSLPQGDFWAEHAVIDDVEVFGPTDAKALVHALNAALAARGRIAAAHDTFALLLIDGLSVCEERVVSVLSAALGDIPVVGGSAGDGMKFESTAVYARGAFGPRRAVVVLVNTVVPFTLVKTQHFVPGDVKMVVTSADVNRRVVKELNAEPAAQEYARLLGVDVASLGTSDFATHPVVVRVGGGLYVRSIQRANPDGSLQFYCAIDEGLVLSLARGVDLVSNLEEALARVRQEIGPPQLIIGFDCILRRVEIERSQLAPRMGAMLSNANVVGFSTYGEQFNAMHINQTFTGVALGARRPA